MGRLAASDRKTPATIKGEGLPNHAKKFIAFLFTLSGFVSYASGLVVRLNEP